MRNFEDWGKEFEMAFLGEERPKGLLRFRLKLSKPYRTKVLLSALSDFLAPWKVYGVIDNSQKT